MPSRPTTAHAEGWLVRRPWALALLSACFVLGLLGIGAQEQWDLGAPVGHGFLRIPLGVLLFVGVPLFGLGVPIGILRQVQLATGRGPAQTPYEAAMVLGAAPQRVVFVSPHGDARAVMAAAYLRMTLGTRVHVDAAGVAPTGSAVPRDVHLALGLDQVTIDPATRPLPVTRAVLRSADLVVRIACRDTCPVPRGTRVEDWDVPPVGPGITDPWPVRDAIRGRVEGLIRGFGIRDVRLDLEHRPNRHLPSSAAAGRATVPYPTVPDTAAGRQFARAERHVLAQVAVADATAAEVAARSGLGPGVPVPWLLVVGRAETTLAAELAWRQLTGGSTALSLASDAVALVVDWLAAHRALVPLPEDQLRTLVDTGAAERAVSNPPSSWPVGLAGEYPVMAEQRFRQEDASTRRIVADRMLAVWPDLVRDAEVWKTARRSAAHR